MSNVVAFGPARRSPARANVVASSGLIFMTSPIAFTSMGSDRPRPLLGMNFRAEEVSKNKVSSGIGKLTP